MDQSSGLKIKNGIITEYTGQNSDVIIPDNVKGISSAVFKDCHTLRSVILPAGLETIDSRCFEGCDGLKTIMFSSGLKNIGKYAFAGCSSLKMHKLPAGLESVEAYAFKDCTALTSMEIPPSVTDIGVGAFEGCVSMASVRIPGRYTGIGTAFGTHPFTGCSDLTIYAPVGTDAEKCGEDNGIPVINISAQGPTAPAGEKKEADEKAAISDALDAAYSQKQQASSKRPSAGEKVKFGFGTPEPAGNDAAMKAAAELQAAHQKEQQDKENRRVYNEAAALYESGAEGNMQKAIDMMRSLGSFDDSRLRAKEFSRGLKKKQKEVRKAEAEIARQERLQAAEQKKAAARERAAELEAAAEQRRAAEQEAASARRRAAEIEKAAAREQTAELEKAAAQKRAAELEAAAEQKQIAELEKAAARAKAAEAEKTSVTEKKSAAQPKSEKVSLPKPKISRKLAVVILVVVVAVGAGIGAARYFSTHKASSGGSDYTLTLEDYINSNDAAKQQLVQSVEGTDVVISVSGNTLIYTYDLSSSNSMTPEIAQSDELRQSLGETLDASDEQFTELCAGLEKDTGISGVSVEVSFKYGNEVLLQRTYTSEGKQQ